MAVSEDAIERRRRQAAKAQRARDRDAYFAPWLMRVILVAVFAVGFGMVVNYSTTQTTKETVDKNGRQLDAQQRQTAAVQETGYKNRAAQCEVIFYIKAPVPPSCLEPDVVRNLPVEVQQQSPFRR